MARGKLPFKERDVARAIRAAAKSGTAPQRVEIDREGKITIILSTSQDRQEPGANPWDDAV
jgi:hypothetical protein